MVRGWRRGVIAVAVLAAVSASAPARAAAPAAPWPRFVITGWLSPPPDSISAARYAEMEEAGFNLVLGPQDDPGLDSLNRVRLDAGRGTHLKQVLLDVDLDRVSIDWPATATLAETIARRYRDEPSFAAWYLGDEPRPPDFARLGDWFEVLRRHDPHHPGWNNLLGRNWFPSDSSFTDYLRRYVAATRPSALCVDEYDFLEDGDLGLLTDNVALLASVARENGLPFWGVLLVVQHARYRAMTPGLLRYQAAQYVVHGARGIGYFTYWTPAPDPNLLWHPAMIDGATGQRTALYDMVRELNLELAPVGNVLAGTTWLSTAFAGSVPIGGARFAPGAVIDSVEGRAVLGLFADSLARPLAFVANLDSVAPANVRVRPSNGRGVARLAAGGGAWTPLAPDADGLVTLAFAPGDFALLRFTGVVDSLLAGGAPRLDVTPNPARDEARFGTRAVVLPARLAVYDASGRRVWSRTLGDFAGTIGWRGESDRGGNVRPGVYFARLTDARGQVTRRVVWLGPS